jgi:Sigma-70 region 2
VSYALEIARSVGPNNKAAARKLLPVFQTRKKDEYSSAPESPRYGSRKLEKIQEKFARVDALEQMFVESHRRFVAVAHSILRNREDAEDAVQEAFFSAHRHWRSFEGRSALSTWLTRIALNAALMIRRNANHPQSIRSPRRAARVKSTGRKILRPRSLTRK